MRKKKNVLLIVESSTDYGRGLARGISNYTREHENWILHIEDRGLFSAPTQLLQGWSGDGIISRTSSRSIHAILRQSQCPIVELLSSNANMPIEVLPDETASITMCVKHFIERRVAAIAFYAFGQNWWIKKRKSCFLNTIEQYKIPYHVYVDASASKVQLQPTWEEQYDSPLKNWLKTLPHRTGIIAANDSQALRVLNACGQLGIPIPDQIAVLGIDNDDHLCNLATPTLSSLERNTEIVGYKAAELLDLKMKNQKLPLLPIIIPPKEVVQRRSTGITYVDNTDLAEALRYISEFAIHGIGVDEVAKHVDLSRSTLYRLFQQYLRCSPKDEIVRIRLNHAKYLLTYTNLSILVISKRTGYKTLEYFVSMFKHHVGITPTHFRNSHQIFLQNTSSSNDI